MFELLIGGGLVSAVAAGWWGRSRIAGFMGPPGPKAGAFTPSPYRGSIPLVASGQTERRATYRAIYLTNPWVYGAVNKLARDLGRLPLHAFSLEASGERTRVRSDLPTTPGRLAAGQTLDRLLRTPAGRRSRFAHMYGTAVDRLVYGNSLWEILREANAGAPTGLLRRRFRDVVRVEESDDGEPLYYEIASRGGGPFALAVSDRSIKLGPEEVVHFGRGGDPESVVGISPLESCKYTIALYEAVVRQLVAYFANEARPSGVVQKPDLKREQANLIRELITEWYSTPENAGKVLVTSGEWKQITETPEHNKVVDLVHLSREEVATVYGVPPPVIGILEDAIKSNVKELREEYVREGLGPLATEFEEELMAQLLPLSPSWRFHFVKFQLAERLRPDLEGRSVVYQRMKHMQAIDEQRELEDMQRLGIKGITDVPWVDSGAMPITAFEPGSAFMDKAAEAYGRELAIQVGSGNGHKKIESLETIGGGGQ